MDIFFHHLYRSAAEPLADDVRCSDQNSDLTVDDLIHTSARQEDPDFLDAPLAKEDVQCSMLQQTTSFRELSQLSKQSQLSQLSKQSQLSNQIVRSDTAKSIHRDLYESGQGAFDVTDTCLATGSFVLGLPLRYLPHQRISDLYWVFQSVWESSYAPHLPAGSTVPCIGTFTKRWRVWSARLKFRKSSQHAQCQTCWELQQTLRSHKGWGEKVQAARTLRQHYQDQYADRCIYWSLRWASRHQSDSILVIIIDSMDRAKFGWPRWHGRLSKDLARHIRPKLVLTAAIAHGWCTCLYMGSELENHGSDGFNEILTRTIEKVFQLSQQCGRPFPKHLVVQADNTTASAKNQYVCSYLAYLVSTHKFITCTLNFLMVGHTHEDVDQLFALVLWLLIRRSGFETPSDILEFLRVQLEPHIQSKGEVLVTVELTAVRNFANWLWPLGLTLDKAFMTRQGIEAPHSFAFKMGANLTVEEKASVPASPAVPAVQADAVYCNVKAYMRDLALQQPPVLCIPAGRSSRVTAISRSPQDLVLPRVMTRETMSGCLQLANLLRDELPRAAAALRDFVYSRHAEIPPFPWLETYQQSGVVNARQARNVHFPHLPAVLWKLVSVVQE